MMTYNRFNTNCPHFAIGCCNGNSTDNKCKYKYHVICRKNYFCDREDCKFGHGITYKKRYIVNEIYDMKYSKNCDYENRDNRCKIAMTCVNPNCDKDHHLSMEERVFIYKMANKEMSDDIAWKAYEKKYCQIMESPASTVMSCNSTVPAMTPTNDETVKTEKTVQTAPPVLTNSYVSLFKKKDEEAVQSVDNTDSTDDMVKIMDRIKSIRTTIDTDTNHQNNIKEQIKKLEEEFLKYEQKVKDNKEELKQLAIKLADC